MKRSPLRLCLAFLLAAVCHAGADTTFSVINTNNSGAGSLADAITNCNNTPGDDTITFDIPGSGPHTITLSSDLPAITSNIVFLNDRAGDEAVSVQSTTAARRYIFTVNAGTTVTFAGLTIQTGNLGLLMSNASVTVRNCYIRDQNFGAIQSSASSSGVATLMVSNSTIANNANGITQFANSGGVVHTTLMNTTVDSNNTPADFAGSAINIQDNSNGASTLLLVNSTLTRNASNTHGATVYTTNASVQTLNSIFVHAGDGVNFIQNGSSTLTSLGHNLSDLPEGGDLSTGPGGFFNATGDKRNTDPLLASLADNGGHTLTRALISGSPAIDAGDDAVLNSPYSLTTDQRGAARKLGAHVDIGAYEREQIGQGGPHFTVTTTDAHDDGVCGPFDCTLPEAVNAANANTDANTITFRAGVTGVIVLSTRFGLPVIHPVTITGPGARLLSLTANGETRIFNIASGAGTVAISDMSLAGGAANEANYPDNCGGLIHNAAASLTLTRCQLEAGAADAHGGAIYNDGDGRTVALTVTECTFSTNVASGSGSAILNGGYNAGHATLNLTNCTLANNQAQTGAAAIYNDGTQNGNAQLTLTNCTFFHNSAASGASAVYNDALNPSSSGVAVTITRNTIFDVNDAATDQHNLFNDGGTFTSQGHNLSNDEAGGDASTLPGGYLNANGDIRETDPLLADLYDNGGPTDTCEFNSTSSLAIDGGDDRFAPAHDQRGLLRNGVSDIGALEVNGIDPSFIAPISSITRSGTDIVITFQAVGGKYYRLERRGTLDATTIWQGVSGPGDLFVDNTGPAQFTDSNVISLGKAFYRVRYIPQ